VRTRPFGPTSRPVPVIGQGTWLLEKAPGRDAIRALHAGFEAGMTHVDTAEYYGDGAAESLVGRAIEAWGRREELFIVSKVMPDHASRRGTVEACERSLERLAIDQLDLYLLHWPGDEPLEETIAGFEDLLGAGKILAWGVSNFDADLLRRAALIGGPGRVACDQVLYHLQERAIEHAVLPACRELGVAMVGYSPFGSGKFPAPGSRGGRVLAELAKARGATPRQVALAFLVREEGTFAIPKAADLEHARENAAAAAIELGEDEVRRIEQEFPRGAVPRELPVI
jgi:diketogulonate reductase-like aldo/keto reductase